MMRRIASFVFVFACFLQTMTSVETATAASPDALKIQLAVEPVLLTEGPEAGNWEYIFDVIGDGTESQFDEWQIQGFDTSLIVNQVPGSPGIIQQKWDHYAANAPAHWHRAAYGSYSDDNETWLLDGHAGEIMNTWHSPDEYKGYGSFISAPRYTGAATIDGGGPDTVRLVSQITSGALLDGLLASLRIVHPYAPGPISYNMYSFNNGGTNYIGTVVGPGNGSLCIAGDTNCDGYVDINTDIFAAFGNFTGPGSYGMTRADGDVEGIGTGATAHLDPHDGDVDVSDIIAMFSNFTGPKPPEDQAGGLVAAEALDSTIPDLIYDASTGEVLLDLDSAVGFTGYVLNSANGFITGNHTPFMAGVTTTLPYELAEATFGTPAGPYPKSIGNVFPSGMDMTALSAFLTGNQVSRGNNQPIVPFDLVIVNPVSSGVPEPAAVVMGLMALAGLGMVAYRRRRAS